MNRHLKRLTTIVAMMCCATALAAGQDAKSFARGGQFKDLILPVPIFDDLETDGIWGDPNVLPRDKQSGIEDIRTVRRRDQDDSFVRFESVHLNEQCI